MEENKNDNIKFFTKYLSKYKASLFINNLIDFSKKYAKENNIEILENDIFNTKIDEFKYLFSKDDLLIDNIKNKKIQMKDLCFLPPEKLDPKKYDSILNKKKIEDFKRNNEPTTDAFICKKCHSKKSKVVERQTRSGDEPATVFITCVKCGFSFTM